MTSIQSFSLGKNKAYIIHENNIYTFDGIIEAAQSDVFVPGDTIYLTEGVFSGIPYSYVMGSFTVKGHGPNTIISSDVNLHNECAFIGVQFIGGSVICNLSNNCYFESCKIEELICDDNVGSPENIEIINCHITTLRASMAGSGLVTNSKINNMYTSSSGYATSWIFENCNISYMTTSSGGADYVVFNNCIIETPIKLDGATYNQCLIGESDPLPANIFLDCRCIDGQVLNDDLDNSSDYTEYGVSASGLPYSLIPSGPVIQDTDISIDYENQVLKVTLSFDSESIGQ